jgi:hypothetical protein
MNSDALVVREMIEFERSDERPVLLAEVPNPFGLALQRGIDVNKALKDDPSVGGDLLDRLVEDVRARISMSLQRGADGIFYRLHGACPKHCSPMQYGGHYLERDRELLGEAAGTSVNVLFIAGKDDVYFDFVSDLPAQVFAWDFKLTRVSADEIRSSRTGAVASSDPSSEIELIIGLENYLENLEQPNIG